MKYTDHSESLSLECPHCETKCQFSEIKEPAHCRGTEWYHSAYQCSHCKGLIVARWHTYGSSFRSYNSYHMAYSPSPLIWKPKVDLHCIENENVRNDFMEAIHCYSRSYFNACMIMARRAIQQDVLDRGIINKR